MKTESPSNAGPDLKTEELRAVIREIQERVRARHPNGSGAAGGIALPDLLPLLHARDAAEAKVAAIGTVNPRPPGLINNAVQAVKRFAARLLDWHVREQVDFNRGAMAAVEAILEILNENNRALSHLSARVDGAVEQANELKDIRNHWAEWRIEWERKLAANETQFLRSVADLQSAFQHRATMMESNYRDLIRTQHADFAVALERSGLEIQKRLWADLEKIRLEYERLIHSELRLARQRAFLRPETAPPAPGAAAADAAKTAEFDFERFAERFRGPEEYVREQQRFYLPYYSGRTRVLDIGCGRGEFLELARDAGIGASGIDLSEESVALCSHKRLRAERADLFSYLAALPDGSLDGIFCSQVIEHLEPARLPEFIRLAAAKLEPGGVVAIETPNPECLAIFSTHFYLDPTHQRPVPPQLLTFYMEEFGFGRTEVHRRSPAVDSMPSIAALPGEFRDSFFGGLDYAVTARRL